MTFVSDPAATDADAVMKLNIAWTPGERSRGKCARGIPRAWLFGYARRIVISRVCSIALDSRDLLTEKSISHWFKLNCNYFISFNSSIMAELFRREMKLHRCVFTFSIKPWIWSFHIVVLQRTAQKCTEQCNARAETLFSLLKPFVQWRSRCRRGCFCLLADVSALPSCGVPRKEIGGVCAQAKDTLKDSKSPQGFNAIKWHIMCE